MLRIPLRLSFQNSNCLSFKGRNKSQYMCVDYLKIMVQMMRFFHSVMIRFAEVSFSKYYHSFLPAHTYQHPAHQVGDAYKSWRAI